MVINIYSFLNAFSFIQNSKKENLIYNTIRSEENVFKKKKNFLTKKITIMNILLLLFFSFIQTINSHVCGFDNYPHKKPEVLDMTLNEDSEVEINNIKKEQKSLNFIDDDNSNNFLNSLKDNLNKDNNKRNLQISSTFDPIRIYYDYTTVDSQLSRQIIPSNMVEGLKKVLANTQKIFENILGVRRYTTNLRVKSCDRSIEIAALVKSGVNSDIVIFPFFDTSLANTSTEAYATACIISSVDNRPVAGLIGISPKFSVTKTNWEDYYTNLALHELSHVIVFNPNLFEFFRDKNGEPYNLQEVIKSQVVNGLKRNLLAYPKVLETAKKHFNCSSLLGMELENQGGQGTASSHWEARIMLGDFMIGLSFDDISISEITLALFEDSGWYSVNYYTGGLFKYGKNKGCNFLNSKCITNDKVISNDEFCIQPYQSLCTTNRLSRGICYITDTSNPDDSNYAYFSKPSTGGLFMSDFCPIIAVPTNTTYFYPWSCTDGMSNYPSEFDENISQTSGCFMSNAIRSTANSNVLTKSYRATCYNFKCDFEKMNLSINIGSQNVNCPKEGGSVQVPGYSGNVFCPDFYKMCSFKSQCKNLISCATNRVLPVDAVYNYVPVDISQMSNNGSTVKVDPTTNPVVTPTNPVVTPTNPIVTPTNPIVTPTNPIVTPTNPIVTPTNPIVTPTNPVVNSIPTPKNTTINTNPTVNAPKPPTIDYNKNFTKDDSIENNEYFLKINKLKIFFILLAYCLLY